MPYKTRTLEIFFLQSSQQFPVILLTGPRQTGKTTFLQHFTSPVLIDEIQYAPQRNIVAAERPSSMK